MGSGVRSSYVPNIIKLEDMLKLVDKIVLGAIVYNVWVQIPLSSNMLNIKSKVIKDYNKRLNFFNKEIPNVINKIIGNNKIIEINKRDRIGLRLFLNKAPRTQIKNKCLISGRSRATISSFRLSRICLKENSNKGFISGVQSSSW